MVGAGDRLGSNYVLGKVLGRGAMGVVHEARSTSTGEQVAIKILHPHLATDLTTVARFVQERQALERVHHPNVVQVKDLVVDIGQLGIAMELVDGPDLRRLMARHPLTPDRVVDVTRQLAAGLEEIHAAGIVHRDLKPGNVLVTEGDTPIPKITDFGISNLTAGRAQPATTLVGTPRYLAPEAVDDGDNIIGPPFDVYALGVSLYEMLVGEPPFSGETAVAILQGHLRQPAPRVGGVPDGLADLIDRMLAKQPDDRPRAEEIRRELTGLAPLIDPEARPFRSEPSTGAVRSGASTRPPSAFLRLARQAEERRRLEGERPANGTAALDSGTSAASDRPGWSGRSIGSRSEPPSSGWSGRSIGSRSEPSTSDRPGRSVGSRSEPPSSDWSAGSDPGPSSSPATWPGPAPPGGPGSGSPWSGSPPIGVAPSRSRPGGGIARGGIGLGRIGWGGIGTAGVTWVVAVAVVAVALVAVVMAVGLRGSATDGVAAADAPGPGPTVGADGLPVSTSLPSAPEDEVDVASAQASTAPRPSHTRATGGSVGGSTPARPVAPVEATVPRLVDLSRAEAEAALRAASLEVLVQPVVDLSRADLVVRSDPAAGATVEPGSTVTIWVAVGAPRGGG